MSLDTAAPAPAPAVPPASAPRWRRRRTSLSAHGEPMVWLTGGALAAALMMIIGLLGWIFFEGIVTFWPAPVVLLETLDGSSYMGEVTRTETFRPEPAAFDEYESDVAAKAKSSVAARGGVSKRRLLRTGNFELAGTHFDWVPDFLQTSEERPRWAPCWNAWRGAVFTVFPRRFCSTARKWRKRLRRRGPSTTSTAGRSGGATGSEKSWNKRSATLTAG